MGCSDRFDLDYCQYRLDINKRTKKPILCNKVTQGGVYCSNHSSEALRKEDAEDTIKKLQEKQKDKLHKWLKS